MPGANSSALPQKCLIDTGVIIRAFGDRSDDRSSVCEEFVMSMLAAQKRILIAAPSISEIIRKNSDFALPSTPNIEVVAFDRTAAELLGKNMPEQVLYDLKVDSRATHGYIKYDAMIVACAARWGADCIVHLDRRHFPKLAALVGLSAREPSSF